MIPNSGRLGHPTRGVVVVVGLALLAVGCAPPQARVMTLAERDPAAAVARASQWLDHHDRGDKNFDAVRLAKTRAAFKQAEQVNDVAAWRAYQGAYPWPEDMAVEAHRREASAFFRERVKPDAEVRTCQQYRKAYPDGRELGAVRDLELKLALEAARRAGTVSAYAKFRVSYGDWPEGASAVHAARQGEMRAAFDVADRQGSADALASWLHSYGDWTDDPDLISKVHVMADRRIAQEAVASLQDGDWTPDFLADWVSRNRGIPALARAAEASADALVARAEQENTADGWWAVARAMESVPDSELVVERAKAAGRAAARQRPDDVLAYVQHFPESVDAWDFEGQWMARALRERGSQRFASIERVETLPDGSQRITLDVRGCDAKRLSGISESSFTLTQGGVSVPLKAFRSLEDDRPLDIVVAVDMSGSMATERLAVDQAIGGFSEVLRFRNRSARVGLVAFSDGVIAEHAPTSRTQDFRAWLAALKENKGGASEDTTGALTQSTQLLRAAKAERVIVLMSDEELQMNMRGRLALKLPETPCDRLRALAGCMGWCDTYACEQQCRSTVGPVQPYLSCTARGDHPEFVRALAKVMTAGGVRPFFLVSADVADTYQELARATGGEVIVVPDDAREPAPYVAVLTDIADKLSKQYELTFTPNGQGAPRVDVGLEWRWFGAASLPDVGGALAQLDGLGESGASLRVAEDGAVQRSLDGASWRQVLTPFAARRGLVADPRDPLTVCTTDAAGLACSFDAGRTWSGLADAFEHPESVELRWTGDGLYAQDGDRVAALMQVRSRDLPSSALYFGSADDRFGPDLTPFLQQMGRALHDDPTLVLRVEGHADSRGQDGYNDDLALRRANRVAAAITQFGGRAEQLDVRSFGERRPVRAGTSPADLAANRRVEFVLLEHAAVLTPWADCDDARAPAGATDASLDLGALGRTYVEPSAATLRSREEIMGALQEMVRADVSSFDACYESAVDVYGGFRGVWQMSFLVDVNGLLQDAQADGDAGSLPEFEQCLADELSTWTLGHQLDQPFGPVRFPVEFGGAQ